MKNLKYMAVAAYIISVKGFGKYRLEEISGITKKGRIHITLCKYC